MTVRPLTTSMPAPRAGQASKTVAMCCRLAEEQALASRGGLTHRLPITGAGSGMHRTARYWPLAAGLQAAHPRRGSRAAPASLG